GRTRPTGRRRIVKVGHPRRLLALVPGLLLVLAGTYQAGAVTFTYTTGDIIYVAYQSPSGPNYIVDLGPQSAVLSATSVVTFPNVKAADLDGIIGPAAPDIWVGLFAVANPTTRDGLASANGPMSDLDLTGATILGAVNQVDSFSGNAGS